MTSVKEFVDDTIAKNKIVVFSKTWCPHCAAAKEYFTSKFAGESVKVIELDERKERDESAIQDYLKEKTNARSVPRIFINGKSVGGNSDLRGMGEGEVKKLIDAKA